MPFALFRLDRWAKGGDRVSVAALGLLYFGVYPILFNAALVFTTAVRGALALSMTPVLTMLTAAIFGIEPLSRRKSLGVMIATGGMPVGLPTRGGAVPPGARPGDFAPAAGGL